MALIQISENKQDFGSELGGSIPRPSTVIGDFAKKNFQIFSAGAVFSGGTFLLRLVLAGILGPSGYGLFTLMMLLPDYSEKFFRFGVDDAAVYWNGKGKHPPGEIVFNTVLTSALLSAIPAALLLACQEEIARWILKQPAVPSSWLLIVAVSIPFLFVVRALGKLVLSLECISFYNFMLYMPTFLSLLIGVVGISLLKKGLKSALIAFAVGYAIVAVSGVIFFIRQRLFQPRLNLGLIRRLFGYGLNLYAPNLLQYLHYRVDMLLLALMLTPAEVGYYALAVSLVEALRKIPNIASSLLYVRVSRSETGQAADLTALVCRHLLPLLVILPVPFFLVVNYIVLPALGGVYRPIVFPVMILLPGMIALGMNQLLTLHFYGIGQATVASRSILTGLGTNLLLNCYLIPKYGIAGAAVSSTLSYTLAVGILLVCFKKRGTLRWRDFLLVRHDELREFIRALTPSVNRAG